VQEEQEGGIMAKRLALAGLVSHNKIRDGKATQFLETGLGIECKM
jgi:hypothetical protein